MSNKKRNKPAKAVNKAVMAKTESVAAEVYSKKPVIQQKQYKTESVKGSLHDIGRADTEECILYIATNPSHIEMACIMSECSRFESYVYSDDFDFYDLSLDFKKANFISSVAGVAAIFKRITRVVTYIGQVNSNIYQQYRTVLSAALKLGLPVVEMPHGLIQSGYNLDDDSRVIDLSSFYQGLGKSLPSIASLRLSWYGPEGVGYPRHNRLNLFKEKVVPKFTLITTNTNWYLYSVEDKRRFFNFVFKFAELNPGRLFIWSPHPAELLPETYSLYVTPLRPSNLLVYGLKNDVYFDGIEGSNDLIAYCEDGISTVSTCLLEFEIHKKNVHVFSNDGLADIIAEFESCTTFVDTAQLQTPAGPIVTGMLLDYEHEKFDELLLAAPNSDPRDSVYLDLA